MSDIKYTSDGKKVKVIGNLNNQEKIVQEIYVQSDGTEIPSGENFTVKSLHDEPSISWKEKRLTEVINSQNKFSSSDIEEANKWSIELDQKKLSEYRENRQDSLKKAIKEKKESLLKAEKDLKDFKKNGSKS